MNSFVALDLETTGFSPYNNEIIQIAGWKVKDLVVDSKFNTYVKPLQYIPREVQALTKITPSMVADYPSIDEVLPEFFNFCEDLPFLGHNLMFDYQFLLVKGKEIGIDFSLNNLRTGIDTLKLSRKFFPSFSSHSLDYMVDKLNILAGDRRFHDASYDSYMTKLLYERFLYNPSTMVGSRLPELLCGKKDTQYGKVECNATLSFE